MSFDKHYAGRKDQRTQYRGAQAYCRSCRNHGSCAHCQRDRSHGTAKRLAAAQDREREGRA